MITMNIPTLSTRSQNRRNGALFTVNGRLEWAAKRRIRQYIVQFDPNTLQLPLMAHGCKLSGVLHYATHSRAIIDLVHSDVGKI